MKRNLVAAASTAAFLSMNGCFGDLAADRSLHIRQFQTAGTYDGQFQIDVSQLPPGAVETRVDSDSASGPVASLTIDANYPIRVLLVPATQP